MKKQLYLFLTSVGMIATISGCSNQNDIPVTETNSVIESETDILKETEDISNDAENNTESKKDLTGTVGKKEDLFPSMSINDHILTIGETDKETVLEYFGDPTEKYEDADESTDVKIERLTWNPSNDYDGNSLKCIFIEINGKWILEEIELIYPDDGEITYNCDTVPYNSSRENVIKEFGKENYNEDDNYLQRQEESEITFISFKDEKARDINRISIYTNETRSEFKQRLSNQSKEEIDWSKVKLSVLDITNYQREDMFDKNKMNDYTHLSVLLEIPDTMISPFQRDPNYLDLVDIEIYVNDEYCSGGQFRPLANENHFAVKPNATTYQNGIMDIGLNGKYEIEDLEFKVEDGDQLIDLPKIEMFDETVNIHDISPQLIKTDIGYVEISKKIIEKGSSYNSDGKYTSYYQVELNPLNTDENGKKKLLKNMGGEFKLYDNAGNPLHESVGATEQFVEIKQNNLEVGVAYYEKISNMFERFNKIGIVLKYTTSDGTNYRLPIK